jgi:hypothetical protein
VTPVPAQQRLGPHSYAGSADAIYQSMNLIKDGRPDIVIVFGDDHLYRMEPQADDRPAREQRRRGLIYCSSISTSSGASACQSASGSAWAPRSIRAVYSRPDLARALEFYDRWLPGAMRRITGITGKCMTHCVMLRGPGDWAARPGYR